MTDHKTNEEQRTATATNGASGAVTDTDTKGAGAQAPAASLPAPEHPHLTGVPVLPQLGVALGFLVIVFGASYLPIFSAQDEAPLVTPATEQRALPATGVHTSAPDAPNATPADDPFADVALQGAAAFVWDVKHQRALYNHHADERLPLASITKLMTALVAHELFEAHATVPITTEAIGEEGDSGLLPGEQFSLQELIDLTLVASANDGAYALAAAAADTLPTYAQDAAYFVELMNAKAVALGLTRTSFANPTGLDESAKESGGYGSARDVTFLMEHLITRYPELLAATAAASTRIADAHGLTHNAENTNRLVAELPGIIASKTGYTDLAGGNLTVAFNAGLNHPIIVTVLGSTHEGRFHDVASLVTAAHATVQNAGE